MRTNMAQPSTFIADVGLDKTLGSILDGRYRVDSCLGQGGMGAVYSATDLLVNRQVAIKIVLPHYALDATSIMRLQQEARAIGRLDHPNIIRLHDFCVPKDGRPFLVVDLLIGCTLADLIRSQGQLPTSDVLEIFAQTCAGLENAHEHGVLHRDLKPSNIMIVDRDRARQSIRILDFGMAKLAESAEENSNQLTKTGQIFGSPLYMSPEQAGGNKLDVRADIYSLGCSLFEALAGVPPFVGDTAIATIIKHQTDKPVSLREASLGKFFPSRLERLVQKMLEKNPAARYQTVSELLKDLQQIDVAEVDEPGHHRPAKPSKRNNHWSTLTIVGLVAAIIVSLVAWWWHLLNQEQKHQAESAPPHVVDETVLPPENINEEEEESNYSLITAKPRNVLKLRLTKYKLSDKCLEALAQFPNLRELNLGNTTFDSHHYGLRGIEGLPVQKLILSRCHSATQRNFEQVSHIQTLESLEANDSNITDGSLVRLTSCRNLNELDLNSCPLLTDAGMQPLSKMPQLRVLELQNCRLGDRACKFLGQSKSIEELDLTSTDISDIGLAQLARMPKLRMLWLKNTKITSRGISFLAKCTTLDSLYAYGAAGVSADAVSRLRKSKFGIDTTTKGSGSHWTH